MNFKVIIPARYNSGRLPGKPLVDLDGKTMIQRVYEQATKSQADKVIIATDDERVESIAHQFNAECVITHHNHPTGTDRIAEVIAKYNFDDDDIVVNVQGDEPFIPSIIINQVASEMEKSDDNTAMATLSCPVAHVSDIFDTSLVKIVTDKNNNALYFSRAPIPWDRESFSDHQKVMPFGWIFRRHIGIYAYKAKYLKEFVRCGESPLETIEKLEQLRFLWNGYKIRVTNAIQTPPAGIDTNEDLKNARLYLTSHLTENT